MPRQVHVAARALPTALALAFGACRSEPADPTPTHEPARSASPQLPGPPTPEPPPARARYARALTQQLDLVPPDADAYLVVRDLRPLLEQARTVEQVLAGPAMRAIPGLAALGGGSGTARLAEVSRARELLALLRAGVEGSGVAVDQGLVVVQAGGDAPLILFAAADLQRLGALAGLLGAEAELTRRCAGVAERAGWFVCSLADGAAASEALARYRPAEQGSALAQRLATRLGLVDASELEPVNAAMSLAERDGSLDAVLRTDPDLWELAMPVPLPPGDTLLAAGPAPALAALVPGTSFAWARVDPSLLGAGVLDPAYLTGELWLGLSERPDGFIAELGITDAVAVGEALESVAAALPESLEPSALVGVQLELDRASLELAGQRRASIGVQVTGDASAGWAAALGVPPRARLWAGDRYLSVAVGEVQAIPAALTKRRGAGPSVEALASLPSTLARALAAGEVGLILHVALDTWQAPPSEAELASLWAELPADQRPDPGALAAAFQLLAPWSSVDLWLRRGAHDQPWIAQISLVPFAAAGDGLASAERQAASAALEAVLAGAEPTVAYGDLAAGFPSSPRAPGYRARAGLGPDHHAVVGAIEVGLLVAVLGPALADDVGRAKTREAQTETEAILNAALQARARHGSCAGLVGAVGPTPPLSVQCHAGAGGRCQPVDGPGRAPGEYPRSLWTDDPLWTALDYRPNRLATGRHRYHYGFSAVDGPGGCRVRVTAVGDLDGDGQLASYIREATIAGDGTQTIAALQVEDPEE